MLSWKCKIRKSPITCFSNTPLIFQWSLWLLNSVDLLTTHNLQGYRLDVTSMWTFTSTLASQIDYVPLVFLVILAYWYTLKMKYNSVTNPPFLNVFWELMFYYYFFQIFLCCLWLLLYIKYVQQQQRQKKEQKGIFIYLYFYWLTCVIASLLDCCFVIFWFIDIVVFLSHFTGV